MIENKVLVSVNVPILEKKFDVYFTKKDNVVVQTRGVRKRDRIRLLQNPERVRDFSNYLNNWEEMLKKLR